jgi:DNA polymerase V
MDTPTQAGDGQLFALVDCNNFYVSCERAFNPKLENRPVVVLSNNDGCAVARSSEVKALGVRMGTPWFQMKDLARQHGIIALSSNYTLYGDMSNRVMTVLRDFSPDVEVYSIDESFLSLNGLQGLWPTPTAMGQSIRKRVLQWTGLPVCVGVATSKTLSKLANHVAKKRPEFNSVCDFTALSPDQLATLFSSIDVGEVWGVGRRIGTRLREQGIDTVQALKEAPLSWLRSEFGVVTERTGNELRGVSCLALEDIVAPKKQIISSRSFGIQVGAIEELREAVSSYVATAAEKLRTQNSVCTAVHVFIHTNRFREDDAQYANGITVPLPEASSDTRLLTAAALFGLRQIYRSGFMYKKAGVMLLDISGAQASQGSFFEDLEAKERSRKLMRAVDALNGRLGRNTVALGAAGTGKVWSMKSDNRTPRYTTEWGEVPTVFAR